MEPFEYAKALNFNDPDVSFDTLHFICKKVYKEFASLLSINFQKGVDFYYALSKIYRGAFFQYTFPTVIELLEHR